MKTLEDFKKQLREKDLDTLPHRALRLQKLDSLKIPLVPTLRVFDYVREARSSFVNGCYRSCIICSSNAVEQSFAHKLIVTSEDWEKTYWELRVKERTFGRIINKTSSSQLLCRWRSFHNLPFTSSLDIFRSQ